MAKRKKSSGSLKLILFLIFIFFGILYLLKPRLFDSFSPATKNKSLNDREKPQPIEKHNNAKQSEVLAHRHLEMGIPVDDNDEDDFILNRYQYVLSYNRKKNVSNWVSWNLNKEWYGSVERYRGKFIPDPDLPPTFYRVQHEDYTNSGYDRGHIVRSEERTRTESDNLTTFYTTNILPQRHELNAGPWLRLEEYCQKLCQQADKELYVIAGGIFGSTYGTIGKGVAVPISTWKIIVVLNSGEGLDDVQENTTVIAVNMPNEGVTKKDKWPSYVTSVDELERLTGYDFLNRIPTVLQEKLERKVFGK